MTATQIPIAPDQTHLEQIGARNLKDNRAFWVTYPWPQGGDEWSKAFGGSHAMWHGILLPRIHWHLPAPHVLEIAPGHGRCTQFLRQHAERLTIVDLVPECIAVCKGRFAADTNITYGVNDGKTLPMVEDGSVDFAFTWDSLVHAERTSLESYVKELARVLGPRGSAFIHHSNVGAYWSALGPECTVDRVQGRAITMSAEAMRQACEASGLACFTQELISWGSSPIRTDCISVIGRSETPVQTRVTEHNDWPSEMKVVRERAHRYRSPGDVELPWRS
ncbi:MAG: class I SAM-dependent methyltransferase [Pyrinomonadaceae bacterium]|nr:class I SAM-dependent methyltransferase [Phycisphaerales bacterium]